MFLPKWIPVGNKTDAIEPNIQKLREHAYRPNKQNMIHTMAGDGFTLHCMLYNFK